MHVIEFKKRNRKMLGAPSPVKDGATFRAFFTVLNYAVKVCWFPAVGANFEFLISAYDQIAKSALNHLVSAVRAKIRICRYALTTIGTY